MLRASQSTVSSDDAFINGDPGSNGDPGFSAVLCFFDSGLIFSVVRCGPMRYHCTCVPHFCVFLPAVSFFDRSWRPPCGTTVLAFRIFVFLQRSHFFGRSLRPHAVPLYLRSAFLCFWQRSHLFGVNESPTSDSFLNQQQRASNKSRAEGLGKVNPTAKWPPLKPTGWGKVDPPPNAPP